MLRCTIWLRRTMAATVAAWAVVSSAATVSTPVVYRGMCDASGAVALDSQHFAVASDEDSVIRIYDAARGGRPVKAFDLTGFLTVNRLKPETDLEAACWLGDTVYWISSHSLNRTGQFRPNRDCLFATSFSKSDGGFRCVPEGKAYHDLLEDLVREPRLESLRLDKASQRPPKSPGALDIEGLCATPEGDLLIGFRNPVPKGRALLVPLLNPRKILDGDRAKFGDPILLDLGGRGVRDITRWRDGYFISAGPFDGGSDFAFYTWAGGKAKPKRLKAAQVDVKHFHTEAVIVYPDKPLTLEFLSDDGAREVNGRPSKELPESQREFRGVWMMLTEKEATVGGGK